jgi:hypothetical protein
MIIEPYGTEAQALAFRGELPNRTVVDIRLGQVHAELGQTAYRHLLSGGSP